MKLKNLLSRIPRPVKACSCAILLLAAAIVYYIALGCPTLTFRQEFRRAEKAHLVGPSTIVDTLTDEDYWDFNEMIVGETEHGITFFGFTYHSRPSYNIFTKRSYVFSYREKTGDITVSAAPNFWGLHWDFNTSQGINESLPVYIFTNHPEAVRAEIELTVSGNFTETIDGEIKTIEYSEQFFARAVPVEPGIFRCYMNSCTRERTAALYLFSRVCSENTFLYAGEERTVIPITVSLYDQDDNLIAVESLEIKP